MLKKGPINIQTRRSTRKEANEAWEAKYGKKKGGKYKLKRYGKTKRRYSKTKRRYGKTKRTRRTR